MIRFNEPKNQYGMFIAKKMIKVLRVWREQKGSRGEVKAFVAVMKEHVPALMDMGGYVPEKVIDHIITASWKIQCGFNSQSEFNESLEMMLVYYASVRIGQKGYGRDWDEFEVAMSSGMMFHDHVIGDQAHNGSGGRLLPFVHYLNGHLINHGMTPISFHQEDKKNEIVGDKHRREHDTMMKVYAEDGSVIKIRVEKRPEVVKELTDFLTKILEEEEMTLEYYEEAREVDHPMDTNGERQKKRRRTMLAP